MIVAGGAWNMGTVKIFGDRNCSIPNLPFGMSVSPQMFLNDKKEIIICGGNTKSCLRLEDGNWQEYAELNQERGDASGISMGNTLYMFGGGWTYETEELPTSITRTSEMLIDGKWMAGPVIPGKGVDKSCAVAISKTELLLIGGFRMNGNKIIKYNIQTNNWTEVGILHDTRNNHRCLLFKNKVFIISGCCTKSVETFSLDTMKTLNDSELQLHRQMPGAGFIHYKGKLSMVVFGGTGSKETYGSFEFYDEGSKSWHLSDTLRYTLENYMFGYLTVPSHIICP